MTETIGLYEYLGVEVDAGIANGTSLTHVDEETYDDDAGLGQFALRDDGTLDTRTNGETFDDDAVLEGLGSPADVGTDKSGRPSETYDEHGLEHFSDVRGTLESTDFTKVDGETYDDSGLGGFAEL